jgi:hypothetical protein
MIHAKEGCYKKSRLQEQRDKAAEALYWTEAVRVEEKR